MKFTARQIQILERAKEKGFVNIEDFNGIFSSPISRKANIERFIALGIFTKEENDEGSRFILNSTKLEELQNE